MIKQLRAEVAQLRDQMQARSTTGIGGREGDGVRKAGAREGDGAEKAGPRDGDGAKSGPRDGEKPRTGARDGEGAVKKTERDN